MWTSQQMQNLESRAKNARCKRTLTFILSLPGRGDRKRGDSLRNFVKR
jgi:hypothetical protein